MEQILTCVRHGIVTKSHTKYARMQQFITLRRKDTFEMWGHETGRI